jgi:hypothetical protein
MRLSEHLISQAASLETQYQIPASTDAATETIDSACCSADICRKDDEPGLVRNDSLFHLVCHDSKLSRPGVVGIASNV